MIKPLTTAVVVPAKQTTAGASNKLTPTEQQELKALIAEYLDDKGLKYGETVYVGDRKIMVVLEEQE